MVDGHPNLRILKVTTWVPKLLSAQTLKTAIWIHDIIYTMSIKVVLPPKTKASDVDRDGNSGTDTRYLLDTQPDGAGHGNNFLPISGTRTRPEPRRVRGGYFFPPAGTRYFTTAMILGCEQVKMCSFYEIKYDLF
jgi:hypothetical protein